MLIDQRRIPRFIPENGNLYYYDTSRSKYLSVNRETFIFGIDHKSISGDRYMSADGKVKTMVTGVPVPRKGTIISLAAKSRDNTISRFRIRKNGNVSDITSLSVSGASGDVTDNLDIDIDKNDWLQAFLTVDSGEIHYPILTVEIAWRR